MATQEVWIDAEEHLERWGEVLSLVTMPNNEIVEKEGLDDQNEILRHIKTSLRKLAEISIRELTKKSQEKSAQNLTIPNPISYEQPVIRGNYKGVAGSYEDY